MNPCLWEDDETEGGEETENECEKKAVALAEKFGDENTIPTQSEICRLVFWNYGGVVEW